MSGTDGGYVMRIGHHLLENSDIFDKSHKRICARKFLGAHLYIFTILNGIVKPFLIRRLWKLLHREHTKPLTHSPHRL